MDRAASALLSGVLPESLLFFVSSKAEGRSATAPSTTSSSSSSICTTALVVGGSTAAVLVWWYRKKRRSRPKLPYPPGPKGVFFFGNTLDFPAPNKGFLDEKLLEWTHEYGPVYTLDGPIIGKMILCADPSLIKYVTVTKNYPKSFTYKLFSAAVGSQSMVILEGQEWAAKRKAFNPGFTTSFLKTMVGTIMAQKLERFIACIEQQDVDKDEITDMLTRAQTFTSDVIVSIAFGEDWGGSEPHPARSWETEIAQLTSDLLFSPMKLLFGFGTKRKVKRYEKLLDDEMMRILDRRLADTSSNNSNSKDICSLAINQLKGPDGSLTQEDKISITHQLKTFYFAGHDTTAILISWAIWLLSQHDDILQKVRDELETHGIWKAAVGDGTTTTTQVPPPPPPTFEELQKCEYLEATLKETLRLYPPAGTFRYTTDMDASWNGYALGGAILLVSTYVLHRLPSLWKDPDTFQPDRWLDGSEENLNEKFMAFSRGPRDCIGKYFALLEAKLAISALVTRFDFDCVDPNERLVQRLTNLPKDGAQMRFRRQQVESSSS